MEKPDGLVALPPDILDSALRTLKLRDLPGVGRRMEYRLNQKGIHSMNELMDLDRTGLGQLWGSVHGERMWHLLRGVDMAGESYFGGELEHAKSVGHSHILAPELRTAEGAWGVAHKLLHKSAMRMRAAGLWAGRLTLYLRYVVPQHLAHSQHFSGIPQLGWSDWTRFAEAQSNTGLIRALVELWNRRPQGIEYERPFQVGLTLDELIPDSRHNFNLFESREEEARQLHLAKAMDRLNQRYGLATVAPLAMLRTQDAAPTRIAFSSIPDLFEDTTPIPGVEEEE
jgi:DNA polymerase-4